MFIDIVVYTRICWYIVITELCTYSLKANILFVVDMCKVYLDIDNDLVGVWYFNM